MSVGMEMSYNMFVLLDLNCHFLVEVWVTMFSVVYLCLMAQVGLLPGLLRLRVEIGTWDVGGVGDGSAGGCAVGGLRMCSCCCSSFAGPRRLEISSAETQGVETGNSWRWATLSRLLRTHSMGFVQRGAGAADSFPEVNCVVVAMAEAVVGQAAAGA